MEDCSFNNFMDILQHFDTQLLADGEKNTAWLESVRLSCQGHVLVSVRNNKISREVSLGGTCFQVVFSEGVLSVPFGSYNKPV